MCFRGQGQPVEPLAQILNESRGSYPVRIKIAFSQSQPGFFRSFLISTLANNSETVMDNFCDAVVNVGQWGSITKL